MIQYLYFYQINNINPIFKYNGDANFLAKYLKSGYNNNNVLVLDVCLYENGPSLKTQLLNIFNDNDIVANSVSVSIGYDKWLLSNTI